MKSLGFVISLLLASGASATISVSQNTSGHTFGCGSTVACDATVSATGSGHLGVLIVFPLVAGRVLNSMSDDSGSTWTVPSTCIAGLNPYPGMCGYALSLNSGATTITATFDGAPQDMFWFFVEYSTTQPPFIFDTLGGASNPPACASCPGIALSLSGTNEVIVQMEFSNLQDSTAISGTYTSPQNFGIGVCGSINTSNGSAPTWTMTGSTTDLTELAIAFKETISTRPPGQFPRVF